MWKLNNLWCELNSGCVNSNQSEEIKKKNTCDQTETIQNELLINNQNEMVK